MNGPERLHDDLVPGPEAALLVDSLSATEADTLHALLVRSRESESADVHYSVDAILGSLPSVLRSRVGKALRGGDR